MMLSDGRKQQWDAAAFDHALVNRPDVVIPILQAGVLARRFCETVAFANVEAIFERCLYLRCGDDFVCIGTPEIGNGPMTLIGNLRAMPTLRSLAGQIGLICGACITIGNSIRLVLDRSKVWRPCGWPMAPSRERLIDICAALASRAIIAAPPEGLAHCVTGEGETAGHLPPLARVARPRIRVFEHWMSSLLGGRPASAVASREAIAGLIGLGPGLTPSGDDFLLGALAVLDAIGESEAHAQMARAIVDALPGLTTPLSASVLRAASASHVGESLHQIVSLVMTGEVDAAIAAAEKIGHSSGWDMIAGVLTTLRIAAAQMQR